MTALRLTLVAIVLVAAPAAAPFGLPLASWLTSAAEWAHLHPGVAAALFVVLYALAAVLVVPCGILTLAAGFAFGLPLGAVLASAASVLGAAAAFVVGRFVARDWVAHRIATSPRFRALHAATRHDAFLIVLLARLSPLIPYNLLNYALSVTAVRFRDFLLATWIGMLPSIVMFVYLGTLAKSFTALTSTHPSGAARYAFLALGLAATAALSGLIARRATQVLRGRLAAGSPPLPPGRAE